MDDLNASAEVIRHPSAPNINLYATNLTKEQAIWFSEQLQERLKAQAQAYTSVQSRAVTFAGILSAVSVAIIGGVIALYLELLENPLRFYHLLPIIIAGIILASMFITSMGLAIWVSSPAKFHIVGYFPRKADEMINWLNYNSQLKKDEVSILYDALNYETVIKENEESIARKSSILLSAQKVAILAFPAGLLILLAGAIAIWYTR